MRFFATHEWSILPERPSNDTRALREEAETYRSHFRWLRKSRIAEFCGPYAAAQKLGWVVRSPVTVALHPIEEIQFQASHDELEHIVTQSHFDQIWTRDGIHFGLKTKMNLRLYDFRSGSNWEAMFLVNGDGSLEWRLGFGVEQTADIALLFTDDFHDHRVGVVTGLMTPKQLTSISTTTGISLALRPPAPCTLKRGDIIGRLIPIALSALTAQENAPTD